MPAAHVVILSDQVVSFFRTLHPDHRRQLKAGLKDLARGRGDFLALDDKFTGLHRLRVSHFRVVFRYDENRTIKCIFAERRKVVYDLLRYRPDLWT